MILLARVRLSSIIYLDFLALFCLSATIAYGQVQVPITDKLLRATQYFVDHLEISYVYGGSQVGDLTSCQTCNTCLEQNNPEPDQRFKTCPKCKSCSLDCSHFVREIMHLLGLQVPYLTTADMIAASPQRLLDQGYLDVPLDPTQWRTGDIFLYKGHVVLMESNLADGRGTIVHATSGKEVRGSGQGIQRARFVQLSDFRGPLLRVLRHKAFAQYYGSNEPAQARNTVNDRQNKPGKRFRPINPSTK